MTTPAIADGRLEDAIEDQKPLYTAAEARAEADRCLYCADAPCIAACPTAIDIPTFIKKIGSGNVRGSARTIFAQNLLGHSCARVCPVEVLCQGACVYTGWGRAPIQIGRLQRYATATATATGARPVLVAAPPAARRRSVACIGGGPASLSFAGTLALAGHRAVVYEQCALAGGLNTRGVAPHKLKAADALHEVEWLRGLGVEVRTGIEVGAGLAPAQLLEQHDAVFLGLGLGRDTRLSVPGEDGAGVVGATAWIERMKLDPAATRPAGRVLVIGGGNTAIDVARECAQLGAAEVTLVYRRGEADMSGYRHELTAARTEGVRLLTDTVPVAFTRHLDGTLQHARLAQARAGRPVPGTERDLPCDLAVVAIGQSKLRALAQSLPGVVVDADGCVVVDARSRRTGNPKVFAGGDCVNGGKEVVNAVADGRDAARFLLAEWSN